MTLKSLLLSILIFSQPLFSQDLEDEKNIIVSAETLTERYFFILNANHIKQIFLKTPSEPVTYDGISNTSKGFIFNSVESVTYLYINNIHSSSIALRNAPRWNVYSLKTGLVVLTEDSGLPIAIDVSCELAVNVHDNILTLMTCLYRTVEDLLFFTTPNIRRSFEELDIEKHKIPRYE